MPTGVYKRNKKELRRLKKQAFQKGCIPWNKDKKLTEYPQIGFQKGQSSWNRDRHWSKKTRRKMGKAKEGLRDEATNRWKGDKAGKGPMHGWVYRHKGKPKVCEHCGITCKERKLAWANKDHKYRRKLEDYMSLCYPCHKKYDLKRSKNNKKLNR